MINAVTNEVTQAKFPWWYTFTKWSLPTAIGIAAAFFTALCIFGVLPIPAALGLLASAPSFFAELDKIAGFALFLVTIGGVASLAGIVSSLVLRGLLLPIAENVADKRGIYIFVVEREMQNRDLNGKYQLEQNQEGMALAAQEVADLSTKYQRLIGAIAAIPGLKVDEEKGTLILPEELPSTLFSPQFGRRVTPPSPSPNLSDSNAFCHLRASSVSASREALVDPLPSSSHRGVSPPNGLRTSKG